MAMRGQAEGQTDGWTLDKDTHRRMSGASSGRTGERAGGRSDELTDTRKEMRGRN